MTKRAASDEAVARCVHESAHAVAARLQFVGLVHAVAAGKDCEVQTRWRRPRSTGQALDALEALAIVDLAGPAGERRYVGDEPGRAGAWEIDEQNASSRAAAIVRLRSNMADDAELTPAQGADVAAVLADLGDRAEVLVEKYGPAIKRVAVALAAGKPLAQDQIDAAIRGPG